MQIILNGKPLASPASVKLDGAPAVLIPLAPSLTPEAAVKRFEQVRLASGQLPAEWAVKNVAPKATVTASKESSQEGFTARGVIDGKIAPAQCKSDANMAWAAGLVKAPYTFPEGITLSFAWTQPVQIAEVVYYGRTAWLWTENFKNYELYVGSSATPIMKGVLKQGHGPQRITLPRVETANKLTLKFLDCYGDYQPGAAEVQIFTEPPPDNVLPPFMEPTSK